MQFKNCKIKVAILLIASILLSSCKLTQTQKMIDNIIPDYTRRMYTVADLIPYTYKEIRNAQALYGMELNEFYYSNVATEAEMMRTTDEAKYKFYYELLYRFHNWKTIKKSFSMYVGDETKSQETKEKERQKEYNDYYKLSNAAGSNVIKKYNDGKLQGMPLMSIRIDMSTATMSDLDSIYSEAMCEVYKPVYIEESQYENLKFGDTIDLVIPTTSSEINAKETKKVTCTYVATNSLIYKNEKDEDVHLYITVIDGTNDVRRIVDSSGETLETYVESAMLQFMKYARVARANDLLRLMIDVAGEDLVEYNFDELAVRALSGGYITYEYKDYIYANYITTNLKGYITSLTNLDNQRIDIEDAE